MSNLSKHLLSFPHEPGCFCQECMAVDRVNTLRKKLAEAEQELEALSKTRPTAADLLKQVTI